MSATAAMRQHAERISQDLRYALRGLGRARLFTAVAVACLALGIAANTTMFSVFDAIVLRPLPYAQPEHLVTLGLRNVSTGRRTQLHYDEYVEWQRASNSFVLMSAHAGRAVAITEGQEPERVSGRLVSSNLFSLIGARAQLGRLIVPDDDRPGAAAIVLVSDALWRRRFGGDASIVGRTMSIDGVPHTIVGVVERGFAFPSSSDLWMPIAPALNAAARASSGISVVGRLRPAVSRTQAQQEVAALGARLALERRSDGTGHTGEMRPLGGSRFGSDEALIATAMLGATTFVLLVACANVANLLLARAVARGRELAVRAALGASRGRIAGQLFSEALLIAVASCVLALPIVWQSLRLIRASIPPSDPYPNYMEWSLDWHTFLFAALVSLLTAASFGAAPALTTTTDRLQYSLKEGGQSTGADRSRRSAQNGLIVLEVALALVLVVGASLFVRTFLGLRRTELGYDAARIMTMRFYLPGARYDSGSARIAAVDDVLRRVSAVPGVEAAGVSDLIPLDDEGGSTGTVVGDGEDHTPVPSVAYAAVAGGWFESLGVRAVAGRLFTPTEQRGGVAVAVVNRVMASTMWRGTSPLGRRFRFVSDSARTWYEVIGVVPDIRTVKLDEDQRTPPTAYVPLRFVPTRDYGLLVRTPGSPAALTAELRAAIHAADPVLPVFNTWTMDDVRYLSFWMYALWGAMFGAFGAIALVLAAAGVYAVIHYGVSRRTREIGVRIALGARRSDVLSLVIGQAMKLVGFGVVAGLIAALALTQLVESLLIGISPTDPLSMIGAGVILAAVAAVASYLPARRATRVDPLVALREE